MKNRMLPLLIITLSIFLSACQQAAIDTQPQNSSVPAATIIPSATPVTNNSPEEGNGLVELTYQPKQCVKTPWEKWYESGATKFIKAPTDAELIAAYYSSKNIEVRKIQKIDSNAIVCEACEVCPTAHTFQLAANSQNVAALTQDGWQAKKQTTGKVSADDLKGVITQALAQKYNKKVEEVKVVVGTELPKHAKGTVIFASENGGGLWFAAKDNLGWHLAFDGNGIVGCTVANKYSFPKEMIPQCMADNGELVKR
jgi:hypothetical protein